MVRSGHSLDVLGGWIFSMSDADELLGGGGARSLDFSSFSLIVFSASIGFTDISKVV